MYKRDINMLLIDQHIRYQCEHTYILIIYVFHTNRTVTLIFGTLCTLTKLYIHIQLIDALQNWFE